MVTKVVTLQPAGGNTLILLNFVPYRTFSPQNPDF